MTVFRFSLLTAAALVAPLALAGAAQAQIVFVQPATPDADALADEMRLLAANPSNVNAMVRAGELTLKLDDSTAAAGFFARAERIDPSNPRIKAGKGTILVQAGRPGEALRLFAEAEALRGDVRRFAADRGLAYDLIGEQERAQRDYRLALKDGPVDETLRRYALSLAISGKRDEALAVIDPLLRRSDRGAWRTRAFILAMTGDSKGAERIAASMMPGGLSQGLQPFFDRLPRLGAVDRAFAVHFGEVRASPQRLADARMTPPLPVLLPEPGRPATAAAPVALASAPAKEDRRARREREKREKRDKRARATIQVAVAAPVPLPQPPAYRAPIGQPSYQAAYNPPPASTAYRPAMTAAPASSGTAAAASRVVPAQPLPTVTRASTQTTLPQPYRGGTAGGVTRGVAPAATIRTATVSDAPVRAVPPAATIAQVVTPRPVVVEAGPTPAPVQIATATIPAATVPARAAPATSSTIPVSPATTTSAPPAAGPAAAPVAVAVASVPAAAVPAEVAAATPAILPPMPGPAKGEDSILAKIIANITVPGSELDVAPVAPEPAPIAAAVPAAPLPVAAARSETAASVTVDQRAADRLANEKAAADAQKLAEKKLADAKKAAEAKKLAETKKLADAKKLAEAKKAEELKKKNDPKLLEPARIWVQVSGGANEGDLAKEWARVRSKAPLAFKGKAGWTTPLRATNRVLAGPFKTDAEARSFVNALSKEGLSAFTFTSEAGQKVSKLAGK
ncbi:SPOR domain-containing protein [Sphingomonas hylomeconis]|uniref:SPOR domain-containing protein n=1 Tax=Sphingomonas hylomeconis TaxID=1395958 RepID=A0ABV7SYS3_9SPHN|nr:SPOR domain-containing protein [Sphingomonas hylomeconis]